MKYHNRKTEFNGILFDSKKEAQRYAELKLLEKAGKIKDLIIQPKFVLQEGFVLNGKSYRKVEYIADFAYLRGGESVVEDVKGMKTEIYKLKKKLLAYKYEIEVVEI